VAEAGLPSEAKLRVALSAATAPTTRSSKSIWPRIAISAAKASTVAAASGGGVRPSTF
jgi:hypothetical protein